MSLDGFKGVLDRFMEVYQSLEDLVVLLLGKIKPLYTSRSETMKREDRFASSAVEYGQHCATARYRTQDGNPIQFLSKLLIA